MNYAACIHTTYVGNPHGLQVPVHHVRCFADGHEVEAFCAATMAQARAIASDWLVRRELDEAANVIEMGA